MLKRHRIVRTPRRFRSSKRCRYLFCPGIEVSSISSLCAAVCGSKRRLRRLFMPVSEASPIPQQHLIFCGRVETLREGNSSRIRDLFVVRVYVCWMNPLFPWTDQTEAELIISFCSQNDVTLAILVMVEILLTFYTEFCVRN